MPQTQNKTYTSTENPQQFQAVNTYEKKEKLSPLEQKKDVRIASSVCVLIQTLAFTAYIILILNDPINWNQWYSLSQYSNLFKDYFIGTVIGCGITIFGLLMNIMYCIIGTVFVIVGIVLITITVYSSGYNGGYDELSSQWLMVIAGGILVVAYNLFTLCSLNVILGPSLFILVQDIAFLVYTIKLFQNISVQDSAFHNYLLWSIVGASITGFGLLLNNAHLIGINKKIVIQFASFFILSGIIVITVGEIIELQKNSRYDGTTSQWIILLAGGILITYENTPLLKNN